MLDAVVPGVVDVEEFGAVGPGAVGPGAVGPDAEVTSDDVILVALVGQPARFACRAKEMLVSPPACYR